VKFVPLGIPEVVRIEPQVFGDDRGFFLEVWHLRKFRDGGITAEFVQENHSRSAHGVLRGLHYQIRQPQGKLVRVISGEVYDVAVDVRRNSPTYGKWVGEYLAAESRHMLWIPAGFAHGFYVTGAHAEFIYACTDFYAPEHERAILWNDPDLNVSWPIPAGEPPVLSPRDAAAPQLRRAETYR
jgi:dTDP-4-dehydrorhamnose 3,5-epimerase